MCALDTSSSIHGTVSLPDSKHAVDILERGGWNIRKAGFEEFEIRDEDFELYIESSSPVLIHGPALNPTAIVERLASQFRDVGAHFSFEVYDPSGKLVGITRDESQA